jgi:hypothetical protein
MLILLTVHLWLLSVFVLLCWGVRGQLGLPDVRLRQPHHGYYGDALMLFGLLCQYVLGPSGWPAAVLGFAFRLDDTYQHAKQVFGEPGYQSVVHRAYVRYLWPLEWVQRLDRWANALLRPTK